MRLTGKEFRFKCERYGWTPVVQVDFTCAPNATITGNIQVAILELLWTGKNWYRIYVPDSAVVIFKTTIFTNCVNLVEKVIPSENRCIEFLKICPYKWTLIENPTERILAAVVSCDSEQLKLMKNPSVEIQIAAVRKNGFLVKYCKQTTQICMEAVMSNGLALEMVEVQTREICLAAVIQNTYALFYVKNQTPEICFTAISINPFCVQFIRIPNDIYYIAACMIDNSVMQFVPPKKLKVVSSASDPVEA